MVHLLMTQSKGSARIVMGTWLPTMLLLAMACATDGGRRAYSEALEDAPPAASCEATDIPRVLLDDGQGRLFALSPLPRYAAVEMSQDQFSQANSSRAPDGYAWHHHQDVGGMQFVADGDHQLANPHTGGDGHLGRRPVSMTIRWKPHLRDEPHPIDVSQIHPIEQSWGVRLPEVYKQLVSQYQGMAPEPCVFNVGEGEDVFNDLLTITPIEERESYSVMHVYGVLEPHLPTGLFPFGRTSGGEYLCFDYRDSPDEPRVVLVTVEMSILPVANNLQEFLDGLHDE